MTWSKTVFSRGGSVSGLRQAMLASSGQAGFGAHGPACDLCRVQILRLVECLAAVG
jgi:hypothetical protein